MRPSALPLPAAACLVFLVGGARGQTSYPMITATVPVAVQRGKTTDVTVEGKMDFGDVYKVLSQGNGIHAQVLPAPAQARARARRRPLSTAVRLRLAVDRDAALGVREFRLASSRGVSSIGQVVIVDDPVIPETGDNNSREKANPIPVPCVVAGRIEVPEDVDFFKFHATAGQALTFEVLCARLEDKIHDLQKHADPLLTLYDAEGRELAFNDDFYAADPLLSYTAPKTGDYYLQIRDAKYDGNPGWVYAMWVTDRPYLTNVYPMAGNPGQVLAVEPVGPAGALGSPLPVQLPAQPGLRLLPLNVRGEPSNPVAFIVSPLPQVLEQEPNDTPGQATPVSIPCGINGRIGAPYDLDYYRFPARRGKPIRFEVKARRYGTPLQSSLDSVLDILTPAGAVLASNDDTFGKDAALVFAPPADGEYLLRIRDLNHKGGPRAIYYIEADWARPDFTLRCDPDKAMIGPGSSTAWFVHVVRQNGFRGPVRVEVQGLPRGVAVNPLTIPPSMTQGLLVLTAARDAPRDAVNVRVVGTAVRRQPGGSEETLTRTAVPDEEIYLPGGGRGLLAVGMQTVAVTGPSDILAVDVRPQRVLLKPGQEVRLDVALTRRPDYTQGVTLDVFLRHLGRVYGSPLPPGLSVVEDRSKTLLGSGSKGSVVLRAAPNAPPIEDVPISVLANVSINFVVKISYSSPPIRVSIRK